MSAVLKLIKEGMLSAEFHITKVYIENRVTFTEHIEGDSLTNTFDRAFSEITRSINIEDIVSITPRWRNLDLFLSVTYEVWA